MTVALVNEQLGHMETAFIALRGMWLRSFHNSTGTLLRSKKNSMPGISI